MLDYPEPMTIDDALSSPDEEHWQSAMNEEFSSMKLLDVISDPMKLPPNGSVGHQVGVQEKKKSTMISREVSSAASCKRLYASIWTRLLWDVRTGGEAGDTQVSVCIMCVIGYEACVVRC